MPDVDSYTVTYLKGQDTGSGDTGAFTFGDVTWRGYQHPWLAGGLVVTDDQSCYTDGGTDTTDSTIAYTEGTYTINGLQYAFTQGVDRSSVPVYLSGGITMEYGYIELRTDDAGATLTKKFKVVAEGYDDGSLDKSQNVEKTIGGGIDASAGEIYKSWSPIIKVRETETESGFGDLADLETFYSYNNPGGTPSDRITLIDHHGDSYVVLLLGTFQKMYLGVKIEGEHAWVLVRVYMQEVK